MPNWTDNNAYIESEEFIKDYKYRRKNFKEENSLMEMFTPTPKAFRGEHLWYAFNTCNWNTKWEVDWEIEVCGPTMELSGQSAWSPPVYFFQLLHLMYPGLKFSASFINEEDIPYNEDGIDEESYQSQMDANVYDHKTYSINQNLRPTKLEPEVLLKLMMHWIKYNTIDMSLAKVLYNSSASNLYNLFNKQLFVSKLKPLYEMKNFEEFKDDIEHTIVYTSFIGYKEALKKDFVVAMQKSKELSEFFYYAEALRFGLDVFDSIVTLPNDKAILEDAKKDYLENKRKLYWETK